MNLVPKNFFLDDFFNDFLTVKDVNNLKCDIYEKDDNYYIEMDANGFKKDDVNIDYQNGYLTVAISKQESDTDEGKTYIRKERYSKEYKRSFYIGDVDTDDIKAEFKDATLKITIPKKEEESKEKKAIEIE